MYALHAGAFINGFRQIDSSCSNISFLLMPRREPGCLFLIRTYDTYDWDDTTYGGHK